MKIVLVSLRPWVKIAVITAYCCGLLPAKITEWIIRKGGLTHD